VLWIIFSAGQNRSPSTTGKKSVGNFRGNQAEPVDLGIAGGSRHDFKRHWEVIYHNYEEEMVTNEEIAKMCAAIEEKYAQVKELKDKLNPLKH
jgi:hypothetical protein